MDRIVLQRPFHTHGIEYIMRCIFHKLRNDVSGDNFVMLRISWKVKPVTNKKSRTRSFRWHKNFTGKYLFSSILVGACSVVFQWDPTRCNKMAVVSERCRDSFLRLESIYTVTEIRLLPQVWVIKRGNLWEQRVDAYECLLFWPQLWTDAGSAVANGCKKMESFKSQIRCSVDISASFQRIKEKLDSWPGLYS